MPKAFEGQSEFLHAVAKQGSQLGWLVRVITEDTISLRLRGFPAVNATIILTVGANSVTYQYVLGHTIPDIVTAIINLVNGEIALGTFPSGTIIWNDGDIMYFKKSGLALSGTAISPSTLEQTNAPDNIVLSTISTPRDVIFTNVIGSVTTEPCFPLIESVSIGPRELSLDDLLVTPATFDFTLADSETTRQILARHQNFDRSRFEISIYCRDLGNAVYFDVAGVYKIGSFFKTAGPELSSAETFQDYQYATEVQQNSNTGQTGLSVLSFRGKIKVGTAETDTDVFNRIIVSDTWRTRSPTSASSLKIGLVDFLTSFLTQHNFNTSNIATDFASSDEINDVICDRWTISATDILNRRVVYLDTSSNDDAEPGYLMGIGQYSPVTTKNCLFKRSSEPLDADTAASDELEKIQTLMSAYITRQDGTDPATLSDFYEAKYLPVVEAQNGSFTPIDLGYDAVLEGGIAVNRANMVTQCLLKMGRHTVTRTATSATDWKITNSLTSVDILIKNLSTLGQTFDTEIGQPNDGKTIEFPEDLLDSTTMFGSNGPGGGFNFPTSVSTSFVVNGVELGGFRDNSEISASDPEILMFALYNVFDPPGVGLPNFFELELQKDATQNDQFYEICTAFATGADLSISEDIPETPGGTQLITITGRTYNVNRAQFGTAALNFNLMAFNTNLVAPLGLCWNLTTAVKAAKRIFYRQPTRNIEISVFLPNHYMNLLEGDIVTLNNDSLVDFLVRPFTREDMFSMPMWIVKSVTVTVAGVRAQLRLLNRGILRGVVDPTTAGNAYFPEPQVGISVSNMSEFVNTADGERTTI